MSTMSQTTQVHGAAELDRGLAQIADALSRRGLLSCVGMASAFLDSRSAAAFVDAEALPVSARDDEDGPQDSAVWA